MRLAIVLILSLAAMPAAAQQIEGSAFYRARIAPPPGAVFEAVLLDVSRADEPAEALGRFRTVGASGPPFAFEIPYQPGDVDPRAVYSVRATLRDAEGRLWFASDRRAPVINRGAGTSVEIEMVLMRGRAPEPPLTGVIWRAFAMDEGPVAAEGQRDLPFLLFDAEGGVSGSGGCNRLRSTWESEGDGALSFGAAASTMMACPDPAMRRERAFFSALGRTGSYAIEGDRLRLLADGAPLATLVAEDAPGRRR